jgi:putative PIN family toxin of toxin-antitoxin system
MRVILDTNVFISGIFWEGNFCFQIIDRWRKGEFELVSSKELIEEFVKTLKCFKIQLDEETIVDWRNMIIENAIIVEPTEKLEIIKEDSDDNKFLETAIAGEADFIISQDNHLLKLREFRGIKVITPEKFCAGS